MAEKPGRLEVQYFDGSNWVALTSSSQSLVLDLEIEDTLYSPQTARFRVADLKDNGIFQDSSTNAVLKEFMNIRILDPDKYIVYFSGKIFRLAKKYEQPYGEILEVVCYDALYTLGNEYLDTDSDSVAASKAHTLISTWIGNHIPTALLSVANDSGDVDRFEPSAYNRANTAKVVKAGRSQISVLSAILQETLQDQLLTTKDRGYVYYVDPNFTSTATSHNPAGFFTYFARNRMPAAEASGGAAAPSGNGLTLERPDGTTQTESGTKHLMMSELDISSSSREVVTDIIANYYHEETGKRVSKRFSIIHFTAHSGMATAQYDDIGFDAGPGTGGTDISNLVDSGGNVIGRIQYVSSLTAFPAFMILSDRSSHALVAGETLSADSHGSGASITLSSVDTIGSQFVYEPKAVWGVTKTTKANFDKESDANEIRTKLAGIFEGRQNVPDRLSFSTSQLPYYWVEGRATSSTTGSTLHDSAVDWETKGVRTGATFLKLSGTGGTVTAYGYVSSLTDAGVITCALNTGTWAVDDYYRWQVRVRAGHQVFVKCVPKGIDGEGQLVTRIKINQNMGSQTITSYETQGTAARSIPSNLAEMTSSAATHGATNVGASAPVPIGDVTGKLTCVFSAGAKSSPDGTRHDTVTWTAGTLKLNKNLSIDGNETDEYSIAQNDTTTANGGALTAGGTQYVLYFQPDVSATELKISTSAAWESADRTKLKIATITTATDNGGVVNGAGYEAECMWDSASSSIVIEGPASTAEGQSSKWGADYFAVDGIQAKHMVVIGSDKTADERFKFFTPSEPADGSTTHWFRGFTGDSVSDTTGKWFEFDVANKALNLYNGAATSLLLSQYTGSALTFYDGTGASAATADKLSEFTTTGLSFFDNSANGYKLSMFDGSGAHIYDGTTATPGSANERVTLNQGGLELHDFATNDSGNSATVEFFAGATTSMGKLFTYQTGSGGINELHLTTATRTGDIGYNFVVGAQAINKVSYIKPLWDGFAYLGDPDNGERFKQLGVKEGIYINGQAPSTPSFGGTTTQYMLYQDSGALLWNGKGRVLQMDSTEADYWVFDVGQDSGGTYRKHMYPSNATVDGTAGDSYNYIGSYHNGSTWTLRPLTSIYSYYHNAGAGSAAAPSFTFFTDGSNSDYDTGIYSGGANILGFSTAGTARWSIGTGGDLIPATDGSGGAGYDIGSGSYEVDKFYGYTIYFSNSASTSGTDLIVTASGQIAKKSSSIQYKDNVKELVFDSSKLDILRPVSYDYKLDNAPDIGLIAEEVDEVYPELINYDKEGKPESVKYHGLSVMLLDEVKKLRKEVKELKEKN